MEKKKWHLFFSSCFQCRRPASQRSFNLSSLVGHEKSSSLLHKTKQIARALSKGKHSVTFKGF